MGVNNKALFWLKGWRACIWGWWVSDGAALRRQRLYLSKSAHLAAILDLGNTLGQLFSSHASSAPIYLHEERVKSTKVFANLCCNNTLQKKSTVNENFYLILKLKDLKMLETRNLLKQHCIRQVNCIFWKNASLTFIFCLTAHIFLIFTICKIQSMLLEMYCKKKC